MGALAQRVFPTLLEPLRSRAELRRLVGDDAAWDALVETPLAATVQAALADDLVRGVVLTDALIGTFAADDDPELRQNRCFLYHAIGGGTGDWDVPIGGIGALTAALRDAALAAGADVRTGVEVTAVGDGEVRLQTDGRRESSIGARWTLANVAPAELDRLRGRDRRHRHRGGLAAEGQPPALAPAAPARPAATAARAFTGTFHVNETAEQLRAAYAEAAAGRIPAPAPCEAYCHTLSDPSILGPELAAAGAHTMTVFALHMPARLFDADPGGARAAALEATLRSLDSVLAEPIADCVMRARRRRAVHRRPHARPTSSASCACRAATSFTATSPGRSPRIPPTSAAGASRPTTPRSSSAARARAGAAASAASPATTPRWPSSPADAEVLTS